VMVQQVEAAHCLIRFRIQRVRIRMCATDISLVFLHKSRYSKISDFSLLF
jgi:hypothetical protein